MKTQSLRFRLSEHRTFWFVHISKAIHNEQSYVAGVWGGNGCLLFGIVGRRLVKYFFLNYFGIYMLRNVILCYTYRSS